MSKKRVIVKTPKGDFEVDKYIKMIQKEEKELEELHIIEKYNREQELIKNSGINPLLINC